MRLQKKNNKKKKTSKRESAAQTAQSSRTEPVTNKKESCLIQGVLPQVWVNSKLHSPPPKTFLTSRDILLIYSSDYIARTCLGAEALAPTQPQVSEATFRMRHPYVPLFIITVPSMQTHAAAVCQSEAICPCIILNSLLLVTHAVHYPNASK